MVGTKAEANNAWGLQRAPHCEILFKTCMVEIADKHSFWGKWIKTSKLKGKCGGRRHQQPTPNNLFTHTLSSTWQSLLVQNVIGDSEFAFFSIKLRKWPRPLSSVRRTSWMRLMQHTLFISYFPESGGPTGLQWLHWKINRESKNWKKLLDFTTLAQLWDIRSSARSQRNTK